MQSEKRNPSIGSITEFYMAYLNNSKSLKWQPWSISGYSSARNYSPALREEIPSPLPELLETSRASPSSPPHLVAGALFLARQWPVQLSPVPGGIIDPQTVQTTTSAWNQAKENGALEELCRTHTRQERQHPHSRGLAAKLQVPHICLILYHIWRIV